MLVDHEPAFLARNGLEGHLQLFAAIAPHRPEHVAGEALRMDAHERNAVGRVAERQHNCRLDRSIAVEYLALEGDGLEHRPPRGQPRRDNTPSLPGMGGRCHRVASSACLAPRTTPPARKPSIWLASKPICSRISSLCSPISGARLAGTFSMP